MTHSSLNSIFAYMLFDFSVSKYYHHNSLKEYKYSRIALIICDNIKQSMLKIARDIICIFFYSIVLYCMYIRISVIM